MLGESMDPVEDTYPGTDLYWDSFTIIRTDFHRHWNGDLVSLSTLIQPARTASETAAVAANCTQQIAGWVVTNWDKFGPEDRFQIVVGWPLSVRKIRRQIVKIDGTFKDMEDISSQRRPVLLREGWSTGIFA